MIEIVTKSAEETKKTGQALAFAVKKESVGNKAFIIALEGDLGSGKTTFIQGLAAGLNIKENVLSPTFVIQKEFPLFLKNFKNLFHIDAYRVKNEEEILDLGFEELIKNPENIIVIEWADRIRELLPQNILKIVFRHLRGNQRKIILSNF